jgi:hypothetical protein
MRSNGSNLDYLFRGDDMNIKPFKIAIPQKELNDCGSLLLSGTLG